MVASPSLSQWLSRLSSKSLMPKSRFIVYNTSPDDVAEAFRRSEALGITRSSFTGGDGRMTGFLGEVAFGNLFPEAKYVGNRSYTHDYELNGVKIDIKSRSCSGRPMLHYCVSVIKKRLEPLEADIYFFVHVKKDLSKVWLTGWAKKNTVKSNKNFKEKGESDKHGFTFYSSGYHLPIRSTRRPDALYSACGYY